jgi:hypothetical protein
MNDEGLHDEEKDDECEGVVDNFFVFLLYLKITFDGQAVCPVVNFAPAKNVKGTFM